MNNKIDLSLKSKNVVVKIKIKDNQIFVGF